MQDWNSEDSADAHSAVASNKRLIMNIDIRGIINEAISLQRAKKETEARDLLAIAIQKALGSDDQLGAIRLALHFAILCEHMKDFAAGASVLLEANKRYPG